MRPQSGQAAAQRVFVDSIRGLEDHRRQLDRSALAEVEAACARAVREVHHQPLDVDFREADLSKADFSGTDLTGAQFGRTNLTGANLESARNYRIVPAENTLKGARFSLPEAMSLLSGLDIEISGWD